MNAKDEMQDWIVEALQANGGSGSIVDICKHIWINHETELRASGDYFYKWQYQMRWDGQNLQRAGKLTKQGKGGEWALTK
ncbi:hypothetical protein [Paracoccus alkanivorans]|uniref:Restriction system protein Mrr-like N-terminal domain-containing protein n=1 Tax=Paracoccus alkanivorans TaxID=2116655 RepID=A0A3M0M7P3_9RHOB|nr:hypothetical protein [Paracoccus alkanivorans]RMC31550.1 hypothetical protein C9E81_19810 [Paracoccus alkanivorans]